MAPRAAASVLLVLLSWPALGQTSPQASTEPPPAAQRLRPGDLIAISVFEAPELATETRLDAAGAITMPEAGRVELAGSTADEAANALAARLRANYLLEPKVQVTVREFAPEPVTVLGAVKYPGVYSARTYSDLASMLAAAGGLIDPEGERILVTEDPPPSGAERAAKNQAGVAPLEFSAEALAREPGAPAVPLRGGEVVRVVPAASVYIGGDVAKPGAYVLPATGLSLVEALSLAGGVVRNASPAHTRIVHRDGTGRASVEWVNAVPILNGRQPDPPLRPFDLVFVPHSAGRAALEHALTTTVATASAIVSGVIIFH